MSDLISREQAIDSWDKLSKRGRTEFDQVLMTLPTKITEYKTFCGIPIEKAARIVQEHKAAPLCALADRTCPFQGKEFAWCLTCPHISEEDRELVRKAIEGSQPKTGEWIEEITGNGWNEWVNLTCDQCGSKFEKAGAWLYCPVCGAKMRGGTE